MHAKRRLRKGLRPLSYHAVSFGRFIMLISSTNPTQWLLSRQERAQVDPSFAYPQPGPAYGVYRPAYGNGPNSGGYYDMHPMPPPVYDPSRPPVYDGPPGSKTDGAPQDTQAQGNAPEYAPPAGPPPSADRRYA